MNILQNIGRYFGRILSNQAPVVSSNNLTDRIKATNNWREQYNPLRGLTLERAVQMRDSYRRGIMADVQWLYREVEQSYPDLMALITRRLAAIRSLDWTIKTVTGDGVDQALADSQADALEEAYERLDNFNESVEHLSLATFRGFSHLEKHTENGGVNHLEILDQWNVVRDGWRGQWKIDPQASGSNYIALPDTNIIDPEGWIIRTVPRHIDWLGLVIFIRSNLAEKDWDSFCECYDVPAAVIIGPPNVPSDKEEDYEDAAKDITSGGSGYLPNGSDVKYPSFSRSDAPFKLRLDYLREQLVLVGTGGLLTMLTAPTGIGKGPSEEHGDVFAQIAAAEAQDISEVLQRQFDKPILDEQFPGKPVLAYFELGREETTDVSSVIDHALKLSQAGYKIDVEELAEKSGYTLTIQASAPSIPFDQQTQDADTLEGDGSDALNDHADTLESNSKDSDTLDACNSKTPLSNVESPAATTTTGGIEVLASVFADDLKPIEERLNSILAIEDPVLMDEKLKAFKDYINKITPDMLADPESARILERIMAETMAKSAVAEAWRQEAK